MPTYTVYISSEGTPATGLSLTWESLKEVDGGGDIGSPPAFSEIGGGFYSFTYSPAEDIVGVVDGGDTLAAVDRYVPVSLSAYDNGLSVLVDMSSIVEGALTVKGVLRLILAALTGKTTGGGTTSPVFRDLADAKARITATCDENGNRTAVTLDAGD